MADNPRVCIFCGRPAKMTSEHIWGEWVQDYVERTANKYGFANVSVPRPGEDAPATIRVRAGDPLNAQVGVVCGDCNSGWMSRLQNAAKPHLIPLFRGERTLLIEPAQKAIAAWVAMATITGEHLAQQPDRVTLPQSARDWLRANHQPPLEGWRIWIGRCQEPWPNGVRVTMGILDSKGLPDVIAAKDRVHNTQATAFKIGKLYLATMTCAFPEIPAGWDWRTAPRAQTRLQQIWPITTRFLNWPAADMTARNAGDFATAFKRYSDDVALRHGYRL
jgi:hypothetical protein